MKQPSFPKNKAVSQIWRLKLKDIWPQTARNADIQCQIPWGFTVLK